MSASPMAIEIEVVDVSVAGLMFNQPETFFTHWCSDEAAEDYAKKRSKIPQMPHIPGRPRKVHVAEFRNWLLKYHQVGGEGGQP